MSSESYSVGRAPSAAAEAAVAVPAAATGRHLGLPSASWRSIEPYGARWAERRLGRGGRVGGRLGSGLVELSGRERVALEAICDTLCPSGDGLAGARELGVADALLEAVARNPRAAERRRFGWLLAAWEAKALSALGGGWERFSRLPRGELYYMLPGRGGGHNPAWAAVGYDGPLGSYPEARPKPLVPRAVERDTTLECDVVVVGLGAGGVPVSVDTPEATSAAYLPGPRSSRRSRRSSRRSERRS